MMHRHAIHIRTRIHLLLLHAVAAVPIALGAAGGLAAEQPAAKAAAPAGDAAKGKAIFEKTCVACHGDKAQGKREVNSPALWQQEPWYIVAQLQKFKAGLRGADARDAAGAVMKPMALMLPDEQAMKDVAAYVTSLQGFGPTPAVKGDVVAGKDHFAKICAACHGEKGRGKPEMKSPALVGQSDWYVVAQLMKFRQGLRGADPKDATGMTMRAMASSLPSDQAVKDVAAYVATLK